MAENVYNPNITKYTLFANIIFSDIKLLQTLIIYQLIVLTRTIASIGATNAHIAYTPSPDDSQQLWLIEIGMKMNINYSYKF